VKLNRILAISLILWCGVARSDKVELDGPAGKLYFLESEEVSPEGGMSFSIVIHETRPQKAWKPVVYFGLKNKDPGNLFYLGLTQLDGEETLSAVYSLYKDGEYTNGKRLVKGIPIGVEVPFTIKWDKNGNVTFTVLSGTKYHETLPFAEIKEVYAASGAAATVDTTHNHAAQPDAAKLRGRP